MSEEEEPHLFLLLLLKTLTYFTATCAILIPLHCGNRHIYSSCVYLLLYVLFSYRRLFYLALYLISLLLCSCKCRHCSTNTGLPQVIFFIFMLSLSTDSLFCCIFIFKYLLYLLQLITQTCSSLIRLVCFSPAHISTSHCFFNCVCVILGEQGSLQTNK